MQIQKSDVSLCNKRGKLKHNFSSIPNIIKKTKNQLKNLIYNKMKNNININVTPQQPQVVVDQDPDTMWANCMFI